MAIDFAELDYPLEKWHHRVWSKVTKGAPDECWLWHGATRSRGRSDKKRPGKGKRGDKPMPYPVLGYWRGRKEEGGKCPQRVRVHRLIYWLEDASLYPTDVVHHTCNNTLCCNPAHLAMGTHQDNMNDMVRSRHTMRGAANAGAKLTQGQVDEARSLHDGRTWTHATLAERYGVAKRTMRKAVSGKSWKPW